MNNNDYLKNLLDELSVHKQKYAILCGRESELAGKVREYETDIKLSEAEMFMSLETDGKNQVYVYESGRYVLSNTEARNAARRVHTAETRRKLASAQSELDGVRIDKKEILDRVSIVKIMLKSIDIQERMK